MRTCKYKGREYELKLIRSFEWGEKACLRFLNAKPEDKDFWVKSEFISDISESDGPAPVKAPRKGDTCPTCGRPWAHPAGTPDDDIEF